MEESEKEILFSNLKEVLFSVIENKRQNPKTLKKLNKFKGRINIGFQIEKDDYFWCALIGENGNFTFSRGKLDDYDLLIKVVPEDLLFM
ncbi:unnamed protein product, partial [marine sediment metagenome]